MARVLGHYGPWEIKKYGTTEIVAYSEGRWLGIRDINGRWRHPKGDARPPDLTRDDIEAMLNIARLFEGEPQDDNTI